MNICINYWGQPRKLKIIKEVYESQLKDNINNFHICYSTWKTEDVQDFKAIFPDAYVIQYDLPDFTLYEDIIFKFKYDHTTVSKDIKNYILGLYIREQSLKTINKYIQNHNIIFDFIITLRPDTNIYNGNLKQYYDNINNNSNILYLAKEPRYDIYNQGAVPDALLISNFYNMNKLISFPIFENIAIDGNIIHPETATGKNIIHNSFVVNYLDIYAFRLPP